MKHSKTGAISPESEEAMKPTIDATRDLDNRFYQTEDQSSDACLYFPSDVEKPVTLRGQCDRTSPVLVNFNASRVRMKVNFLLLICNKLLTCLYFSIIYIYCIIIFSSEICFIFKVIIKIFQNFFI